MVLGETPDASRNLWAFIRHKVNFEHPIDFIWGHNGTFLKF